MSSLAVNREILCPVSCNTSDVSQSCSVTKVGTGGRGNICGCAAGNAQISTMLPYFYRISRARLNVEVKVTHWFGSYLFLNFNYD